MLVITCPKCGSHNVARERRPNGNDRCLNHTCQHIWPSATSKQPEPQPQTIRSIVLEYLEANGYAGLRDDDNCVCFLGEDLMCCLYMDGPCFTSGGCEAFK